MPPTLRPPSKIAPTALIFITVGALITVWSIIWYMYLVQKYENPGGIMYVCFGTLGTGLTLLIIGFSMGKLGRAAREAELPPDEGPGAPVRPAEPNPVPTQPARPGA